MRNFSFVDAIANVRFTNIGSSIILVLSRIHHFLCEIDEFSSHRVKVVGIVDQGVIVVAHQGDFNLFHYAINARFRVRSITNNVSETYDFLYVVLLNVLHYGTQSLKVCMDITDKRSQGLPLSSYDITQILSTNLSSLNKDSRES